MGDDDTKKNPVVPPTTTRPPNNITQDQPTLDVTWKIKIKTTTGTDDENKNIMIQNTQSGET